MTSRAKSFFVVKLWPLSTHIARGKLEDKRRKFCAARFKISDSLSVIMILMTSGYHLLLANIFLLMTDAG